MTNKYDPFDQPYNPGRITTEAKPVKYIVRVEWLHANGDVDTAFVGYDLAAGTSPCKFNSFGVAEEIGELFLRKRLTTIKDMNRVLGLTVNPTCTVQTIEVKQ